MGGTACFREGTESLGGEGGEGGTVREIEGGEGCIFGLGGDGTEDGPGGEGIELEGGDF